VVADRVSMVSIELGLRVASKSELERGTGCYGYWISMLTRFVIVVTQLGPWLLNLYDSVVGHTRLPLLQQSLV